MLLSKLILFIVSIIFLNSALLIIPLKNYRKVSPKKCLELNVGHNARGSLSWLNNGE